MEIVFSISAKKDIDFWKKSGNLLIQKKITQLLESIIENPFEGIGKPEELKYNLAGLWSRRINQEHRLVYQVENNKITILSVKGHY